MASVDCTECDWIADHDRHDYAAMMAAAHESRTGHTTTDTY